MLLCWGFLFFMTDRLYTYLAVCVRQLWSFIVILLLCPCNLMTTK